jgi:hypothetical protein
MNAGALVYCLLDDEGVQTPEGYKLLDSAQVGDYELMLWEGNGHVKGEPVKFNEVSLNAKGRKFDAASQAQKYPGSVHALGHRYELLHIVADWISRFGDLYIGSYQPDKLSVYYRMFKRYLPRLNISEPYAAFDECDGKPEYFHVTGSASVIESILLETVGDADVNRYLNDLPDVMSRAIDEARKVYVAKLQSGEVNDDNFGEWAEAIVEEIVYKFHLSTGDEVVDSRNYNTILYHVLNR